MKQKGNILIYILVVIVFLISASLTFYFLVLKTDLYASNWKSYTDPEYGFSFKYPSTWGKSLATDKNNSAIYSDSHFIALDIINKNDVKRHPLEVGIEVHKNTSNWDLNKWILNDTYNETNVANKMIKQATAVTIDGQKGIKTVYPPDLIDYYIIDKPSSSTHSILFKISLYGNSGEGMMDSPYKTSNPFFQQTIKDFSEMVNTFKFSNTYPFDPNVYTPVLKNFIANSGEYTLMYDPKLTAVYTISAEGVNSCTSFSNQQTGIDVTPLPIKNVINIESCYTNGSFPKPKNNVIILPNNNSINDIGPYYDVAPFSVNGYKGYQAKEKSISTNNMEANVIFLRDIAGGYVIMKRIQNGQQEFNEMLYTLKILN